MKKTLFSFTLAFFLLTAAEAQIGNLQVTPGQVMRSKKELGYKGSRYLYPTYKNALIKDYEDAVISSLVKFDIYKNEIEVYTETNPVLVKKYLYPEIKIQFFDEIAATKVTHILKNKFKVPGYSENYYFEVLTQENGFTILKDNKVALVEEKEVGYGEGATVTFKYIPREKYIVMKGDNTYSIDKLNKSEVISALEIDSELKQYIKKNKLKFKEEADLIDLVNHMNEINAL